MPDQAAEAGCRLEREGRVPPKTVTVNADLGQNPRTGAIWHIDYYPRSGTPGTVLSVVIDSATGKVISKDPK